MVLDVELEPGLRLIASPGHVVGHQSVYVETTGGPVLLTIDAISVAEQITMKRFPSTYPDPEAALAQRTFGVPLAEATADDGSRVLALAIGNRRETPKKNEPNADC